MNRHAAWTCLFLIAMLSAATTARGDTIHRRDGAEPISGKILVLDHAGVTIQQQSSGTTLVPWDQVRSIDSLTALPDMDMHLERADRLWRARSRIQRGDMRLAEPLVMELLQRYRSTDSLTSHIVAESALRCAVDREDHLAAVIPWLEVARMESRGISTDTYVDPSMPVVLDPGTGMSPYVPPIRSEQLHLVLKAADPGADPYLNQVRDLLAAIAASIDDLDQVQSSHNGNEPMIRLLESVIESGSTDPRTRKNARRDLLVMEGKLPEFARPWAWYHRGLSLLSEQDPAVLDQGLLMLLKTAAVNAPVLSSVALERVHRELVLAGRDAEARIIHRHHLRMHPADQPVNAAVEAADMHSQSKENTP